MSEDYLQPCVVCGCAKEMHTEMWCWSVRCVGKHRFKPLSSHGLDLRWATPEENLAEEMAR